MAIKVTDSITAKTVENILADSKEIYYQEGIENTNPSVSANTVSHNLNQIKASLIKKVNLGKEIGDPQGKWEMGTTEEYIDGRLAAFESVVDRKLENQQTIINTLNGNEVIPVSQLPQSGTVGLIYRVCGDPSSSATTYTDYMWDISIQDFKEIAKSPEYPGIDDTPTPNSVKFVRSGGILNEIVTNGSAFDLSAYMNGAKYSTLASALSDLNNNVSSEYKKGGMMLKYIQSSDNLYVHHFNTYSAFTTTETYWEGMDDVHVLLHNQMDVLLTALKNAGTITNYTLGSSPQSGSKVFSITVTMPNLVHYQK